jgi:hypothetical protein
MIELVPRLRTSGSVTPYLSMRLRSVFCACDTASSRIVCCSVSDMRKTTLLPEFETTVQVVP